MLMQYSIDSWAGSFLETRAYTSISFSITISCTYFERSSSTDWRFSPFGLGLSGAEATYEILGVPFFDCPGEAGPETGSASLDMGRPLNALGSFKLVVYLELRMSLLADIIKHRLSRMVNWRAWNGAETLFRVSGRTYRTVSKAKSAMMTSRSTWHNQFVKNRPLKVMQCTM